MTAPPFSYIAPVGAGLPGRMTLAGKHDARTA